MKEIGWLISTKSFSLFLSVVIVISAFSVNNCFALSNEDIVKQFYPQRLIDELIANLNEEHLAPAQFEMYLKLSQSSDFVVADLDGTGTADYIIAAYTNGFAGAIRILKKQGDTAFVVAEPNLRKLGGIFPEIQLLDLDNDKRPEIIVSFSSARGISADWVFKWNGTTLNLMGPSEIDKYGDVDTILNEATFVDLDGDGTLEIINPAQPKIGPLARNETELKINTTATVFKLKDSQYTYWKSLSFFDIFVRNTSTPTVTERNFTVDRTDIPYLLTIVSGDSKGNNRVSSAVITLNGVVVAGPEMFSQKVFTFSVPVNLQASNTISVELRSAPGSKLTITIEP